MTTTAPFTVLVISGSGVKTSHDFATKKAAVAAWHEFAMAGSTSYVLSAKGHTLHGYSADQGPVVVVNGELQSA